MMPHADLLEKFIANICTADERAEVQEHLTSCSPGCREEILKKIWDSGVLPLSEGQTSAALRGIYRKITDSAIAPGATALEKGKRKYR